MGTSTRGKRAVRQAEQDEPEVTDVDEQEEPDVADSADSAEDAADEPAAEDADAETDDAEDDGDAEDEPQRSRVRAVLRPAVLAIALAVLLVAGGAVWAWLKIDALEQRAAAPDEARRAAMSFAKDLGTYDYRDMDGNFRLVAQRSTDNFSGQLRQITEAMTPLLQQTQATSKGSVPAAGVVTADENKAVVVLFLDQTIKNTNTAQPRVDRSRMQLSLVKVDGVWKLDHLEAR